jgi:hypothetical protein
MPPASGPRSRAFGGSEEGCYSEGMAARNRGRAGRGWVSICILAVFGLGCATAGEVSFRLHAPGAREVLVCGSFAHWRCVALHRGRHGVFRRHVVVAPGLYEYGFRVDGRWRLNRRAPQVPDGLGGHDDLLAVGR